MPLGGCPPLDLGELLGVHTGGVGVELDPSLTTDVQGKMSQEVVVSVEGLVDVLVLAALADGINNPKVFTIA